MVFKGNIQGLVCINLVLLEDVISVDFPEHQHHINMALLLFLERGRELNQIRAYYVQTCAFYVQGGGKGGRETVEPNTRAYYVQTCAYYVQGGREGGRELNQTHVHIILCSNTFNPNELNQS